MEQKFEMENNEVAEVNALQKEQASVTTTAQHLVVKDKGTYDVAMNFLRDIKSVAKNIEAYWSEPKRKANESWKAIVAKEREMLTPLSNAETIVKQKMGVYAEEQRRIEHEIQRKQEEARRAEATRLMQQAAEAEAKGEEMEAQIQMSMAESLEKPSNFTGNTKQEGTRQTKKLVISNDRIIPSYIGNVCLRPIDLAAVKKYYQLTGELPAGIKVEIETSVVVR